jgi:hypothetical protein
VKQTHRLELTVLPQQDDTTCGPTCLESIYRNRGVGVDIARVVAGVASLPGGGTLAVWLATQGYAEFLKLGGLLKFRELKARLLQSFRRRLGRFAEGRSPGA